MAKFNIVEEYVEYVTKYYEVEAETEDEAIEMIQNGDIDSDDCDWLVSLEILSEYREVLSRPKFKLSEVIVKEWFDIFETATQLVKVDLSIDFPRDRKDAKFLACAMVSKADFLVTGDRDFEEVKDLGYTRIIMVSQFKALFLDD